MHAKKTWSMNSLLRSWGHGHHIAVGELLVCERELKNTVVMYCGSKDGQFIDCSKI